MQVQNVALSVSSSLLRVCRVRDEYYEFISDPAAFVAQLKNSREVKADVFTFLQEVSNTTPNHPYHLEWDEATVLPLTTYEHWWKKQVNDKTRNMVRKAGKAGVEIRLTEFNDDLVEGIRVIYNESPVRQGRPFRHYGKDFETIKCEHATFLDRSQFIGAYFGTELIGFVKLVHGNGISNLMNIVSLISHRDKAPTNALIAKSVEICTERGVPFLQYGTGNQGSIGEFKKHSAFEERLVPRYYVPLNVRGAIGLKLGLHRPLKDRIPESWAPALKRVRTKFIKPKPAPPAPAPASEPPQKVPVS